ncbi:hypothetical protein BDQ12DRAFT_736793 [Crucibulum laeve]|uniref:MARVEL domain-containing protein n=1 Tax=Crucibulum laeve TaxID=68775 RepID=A0A5C3M6G6_9AGAR|nr:hypothetical protein BDQ12DRAFT_736793 [Crucibulum laeve]
MGNSMYYARNLVLCLSLIFAIAVLGLSASWINATREVAITDFEILALVTSSLTVVLASLWLVVGQLRKNATFTRIATELCLIFVLWSLWLSTGALVVVWSSLLYPFKCADFTPTGKSFCNQFFGIEGLSFLNFVLLKVYWWTLLIMTLRSNEAVAWTTSVRHADFFSGNVPASNEFPDTSVANVIPQSFATRQYQVPAQANMFVMPAMGTGANMNASTTNIGAGTQNHPGHAEV